MRISRLVARVAGLAIVILAMGAADWPQWRGPQRDGISQETGLLKEWPANGPRLVWRIDNIGGGYSTPSVVGDRLYLISSDDSDEEHVKALSAEDGRELWSTRIGKVGANRGPQYPGSRSTPTVDGELLYALGSDGDLACIEAETGKIRWQKNLRTEFAGAPGNWAYSESPLIDGDLLVCTPGGSEATLVALDKNSGETVWKSALPEGDEAAYASPVIVNAAGVKQYVQFLQHGLVGVNAETGELLWRYAKTAENSPANIPTPVVKDNLIYSAAGRSGGGLVRIVKKDSKIVAEEVYFQPNLPKSIGGAVEIDGHLYGTGTQGLACVDFASGEIRWQDRSVGAGSVCAAEDRLYLHGENGDVALVEVNSETYRERGKFTPEGQPDRGNSKSWTYPVVANGRLYLRDLNVLWCYDISNQ